MGTRLTYAMHLPDDLHDATVPPMLLQPLVENAIKHGLESKIGGGHIDIIAKREAERLILSVADTGLGLDATSHPHYLKHGTQVGLSNVRERLHALYGEQAQFNLTHNTPVGTIAQLTIPITT
jgi:sensor histidine kinase YesM